MSTTDHLRRAHRIVLVFVAVVTAAAVAIGLVIGVATGAVVVGASVGLVLGAGVAVLAVVNASRSCVDRVLAASGARVVAEHEQARLHNLVDGLGATIGIEPPTVLVIDDEAANAFVIGRDARTASIAVTTGLLVGLDRIQLEAVVAHLLSRIRNGEVVAATRGAALVGPLVDAPAPIGRWAAPILRRCAPRARIVEADLDACSITRYPPGLVAALQTMRSVGVATSAAKPGTAHLWLAHPFDDQRPAVDTHPPLHERITTTREL